MAAAARGVNTADLGERDAALAAADEIESLMGAVGHPIRLRDIGVPDDDFQMAAFHALADTPTLFNARPVTSPEEVVALFEEAY
jgi:alcohol dehydrogenase class IV